jgi:hypothetical protein
MRALGGHKTKAALLRYAKETEKQRQTGARKRLDARTKRGICQNEQLTSCQNDSSETGYVLEKLGERTRARTWDPMIKSLAFSTLFQWLSCK